MHIYALAETQVNIDATDLQQLWYWYHGDNDDNNEDGDEDECG